MIFKIPKDIKFSNYYKKMNILSFVLIFLSILFILIKGLNLGVDFKGGTLIEVRAEVGKTNIADIFFACCKGNLDSINIEWFEEKSICIVICSKGYPDKYENNLPINNLDKIKLKKNEFIFHAGTKTNNNRIYSNGGRVLNFVVTSNNFKKSKDKAIQLIKELDWQNGYYRRDIGFKVIT